MSVNKILYRPSPMERGSNYSFTPLRGMIPGVIAKEGGGTSPRRSWDERRGGVGQTAAQIGRWARNAPYGEAFGCARSRASHLLEKSNAGGDKELSYSSRAPSPFIDNALGGHISLGGARSRLHVRCEKPLAAVPVTV